MAGEYTIGRIVIPEELPQGAALFYTTADFDGRLTPESVAALMEIVRDAFGIDAALSTCMQVHGKRVVRIDRSDSWRECDDCDALFAAERGIALGIKVADCLPVTIFDVEHDVVANIHSGWRGAAQRITAETLDTLQRETAFHPASAVAYLGPSIRACCFEVGEEVAAQFDAVFVDRTRARPHVDLVGLTREVLSSRGIVNIVDTGVCTRCGGELLVCSVAAAMSAEKPSNRATQQPLFHSYRRVKGSGRNLAIAAI
jgi:YfiH family protein